MAPCATSPRPEIDRLEAKQLRMCLLSKRVVILRQKPNGMVPVSDTGEAPCPERLSFWCIGFAELDRDQTTDDRHLPGH